MSFSSFPTSPRCLKVEPDSVPEPEPKLALEVTSKIEPEENKQKQDKNKAYIFYKGIILNDDLGYRCTHLENNNNNKLFEEEQQLQFVLEQ